MLNEADLNTYLFLNSINKTKTTSLYLETLNLTDFMNTVIKMYGIFYLSRNFTKNFKYTTPFNYDNIQKKFFQLIKNHNDKNKKTIRIKKYCKAVRNFSRRLIKNSYFKKHYFDHFMNCTMILEKDFV